MRRCSTHGTSPTASCTTSAHIALVAQVASQYLAQRAVAEELRIAEETLKLRTYKLGGNVVYIVGKAVYIHGVGNPGLNGTGEAYRCR